MISHTFLGTGHPQNLRILKQYLALWADLHTNGDDVRGQDDYVCRTQMTLSRKYEFSMLNRTTNTIFLEKFLERLATANKLYRNMSGSTPGNTAWTLAIKKCSGLDGCCLQKSFQVHFLTSFLVCPCRCSVVNRASMLPL